MTGSKSPSEVRAPRDRRRLGRVRGFGAAAGLIALILLLWHGAPQMREGVFDTWQRTSPRDLAGTPVVVAEIDADSIRAIGPWPWSRYDIGRLTETIGSAGAVAIGFDMFFQEHDRQSPGSFVARYPELPEQARAAVLALPSLDDTFATVLGRWPTVLAHAGTNEVSVDLGEAAYADAGKLPVEAVFARPLPAGVARWRHALASLPELDETAAAHGLINGEPDRDGVVRRIPAVGLLGDTPNPGFAFELARVALRLPGVDPIVHGRRLDAVRLGTRQVPVGRDGRFRLHFGTLPPGSMISAVQILRRGFNLQRLRGRIVLIGVIGEGGTDVVTTPIAPRAYGIHVQAQAVDAILRGGWLDRPRWAPPVEFAIGIALALAAILFLPRLEGWRGFVAPGGVVALTMGASWLVFAWFALLLDPVAPLLIGAAATFGVSVALAFETAMEQRRLRSALLHERIETARAAGELEAARNIQRGMLPPHDWLAGLDPRIDLDAVLEPARTVGGDFYDAFRLDDGRTAFLIGDVTGKGVPAALFMALSKALSRSAVERRGADLADAVALLSEELSRDNSEDMFVTMLVGTIDPVTGALELVNAGHENPLLLHADGRVEELRMEGGPPVCAAEGFPYASEHFILAPGEGLLVVTDGVTEAQEVGGAFFDRARLIATAEGFPSDWSAQYATERLMAAVRAFEGGAEPSDDLTVLALRRPIA